VGNVSGVPFGEDGVVLRLTPTADDNQEYDEEHSHDH
jgi:hypothetical protein